MDVKHLVEEGHGKEWSLDEMQCFYGERGLKSRPLVPFLTRHLTLAGDECDRKTIRAVQRVEPFC